MNNPEIPEFNGARAFIQIPVAVSRDKELVKKYPRAIILIGEIVAMLNTTGSFFMSNKKIAEILCVTKPTVADYLNILERKKLIVRETITDETGAIVGRKIHAGSALVKCSLLGWSDVNDKGSKTNFTGVVKPTLHKENNIKEQYKRTNNIYSSGSKQPEPRISQSNQKPKKKDKYTQLYKDVISYLNHKTGAHYRATSKATQKLIRARAEEGYTLEDFKRVIDNKAFSWQHSDMWKYMRPQTLFSPKFESYLNENDLRQTERQQPQSMGYEELDEYSSNDSFFSSDNQPPEPQLPPDDDLPF